MELESSKETGGRLHHIKQFFGNSRFAKKAKERLAPNGNIIVFAGTALGSVYYFLNGNPRMGTDLLNIGILTGKNWLASYAPEENKNINYLNIVLNLMDSVIMEGASQVWGSSIYRATHAITAAQILANLGELYVKRNSKIDSTEEITESSRINYTKAPKKLGEIGPESFMSRLYSIKIL